MWKTARAAAVRREKVAGAGTPWTPQVDPWLMSWHCREVELSRDAVDVPLLRLRLQRRGDQRRERRWLGAGTSETRRSSFSSVAIRIEVDGGVGDRAACGCPQRGSRRRSRRESTTSPGPRSSKPLVGGSIPLGRARFPRSDGPMRRQTRWFVRASGPRARADARMMRGLMRGPLVQPR